MKRYLQGNARRALALPILVVLGCQAAAQPDAAALVAAPSTWAASVEGSVALDRCRAEMLETLAIYRDVLRSDDGRRRVDLAAGVLARMGAQDLRVLGPACPQVGAWKRAASDARELALGRGPVAAPGALDGTPAVFPAAPYSGSCGSTRNDTDLVLKLKVALQLARGVWSAASRSCEQVAVVCPAPGGGNTSIGCIVVDEALYFAESALEDVMFCDADIDSAEIRGTYERVGFVHDQIVILEGKIDALARAMEGLRQLGCDTVRLENTPEGQRASAIPVCGDQPGFPYGWPQR